MNNRDTAIDNAVRQLDRDLATVERITNDNHRAQARAEAEQRYLNAVGAGDA